MGINQNKKIGKIIQPKCLIDDRIRISLKDETFICLTVPIKRDRKAEMAKALPVEIFIRIKIGITFCQESKTKRGSHDKDFPNLITQW